jgi:hypothetical protein
VKLNALMVYMEQIAFIIAFVCMKVNATKKLESVFVNRVSLDLHANFSAPLDNMVKIAKNVVTA